MKKAEAPDRVDRGRKTAGWPWACLLVALAAFPKAALALSPGEKDYANGDYGKAEQYFEQRVQKNGQDYRDQYNLGNSLYQLKRYPEASGAYEKSLQAKPDFPYGWYNLGMSLAKQDRYQDAIDAFQRDLDLNPKDSDARQNIEVLKKKIKMNPKADRSDTNGKYRKGWPRQKGGQPTPGETLTPIATPPPPKKKGEKEDEHSKNLRTDQNAKKKWLVQTPVATAQAESPQAKRAQAREEKQAREQREAAQARRRDQQREQQARKELGMSNRQIRDLMARLQKQEEETQQYYSPNPKQDQQNQDNMWNFLPRQQQEFMRRFFGTPDKKGNSVPEDW